MKLELYIPLKPKFITQKFGETANLNYYRENGINFKGHNGIDFVAFHGQPIYAAHSGFCYPEVDDKSGNGVVIYSDKQYLHDNQWVNFKTIYWHFDKWTVKVGQFVNAGDLIGFADSTGLSTGDHLHFGLKPCAQNGEPPNTWYNIYQNNGYMGCIDPLPFFNDKFAEDLPFIHQFSKNILVGDEGVEAVYLQRRLKNLGFFNHNVTGYYGPVTKKAVYEFQKKYVALDFWSTAEVNFVRGDAVRLKTRNALNKL